MWAIYAWGAGLLCLTFGVNAEVIVEQVALTYDSNPANLFVSFAAFSDEQTAKVLYGLSPNKLTESFEVSGSKYTNNGVTSPMLYRGQITNLQPGNKRYFYSVGSDALGFSPVQSFKTHPGVGTKDVTFHIFGDLGQTNNSVATLNELIAYEAALRGPSGGIVSMGDLSYANGDDPLWNTFGNVITAASAHIPMSTTLGNHEWFDSKNYDFTAYKARFNNPTVDGKRELYYSFDSGLVHFVMISGYCQEMSSIYTQPCLAEGTPQMNWLQKDLAGVDRSVTPWVVAVFHQPYVNSNLAHTIDTEGKPMQEAVEDVLNQYKVDLVLSGHVHAYERSCQVYKYKCTPGAPWYITIGDGGNLEGLASTWVEPQPEWSSFRQASYGFGELRAVNSTAMEWRWHQNEDLLPVIADSFTFTKDVHGERKYANEKQTSVTGVPVFADTERGRRGAAFNAQQTKLSARNAHEKKEKL